jgi:hypothetical protein
MYTTVACLLSSSELILLKLPSLISAGHWTISSYGARDVFLSVCGMLLYNSELSLRVSYLLAGGVIGGIPKHYIHVPSPSWGHRLLSLSFSIS